MRTLILLRHGKAVREHEAPSDLARGLTDRGQREATEAGARIAAARLSPDLVLASSAVRTRETAACALTAFGVVETRVDEDLYMATPERVFAAFAATTQSTVLVVGHNPGLSELVEMLIDQANDGSRLARDLGEGLSTASFAAFEIAGDVLEAAAPRLVAGWRP